MVEVSFELVIGSKGSCRSERSLIEEWDDALSMEEGMGQVKESPFQAAKHGRPWRHSRRRGIAPSNIETCSISWCQPQAAVLDRSQHRSSRWRG